MQTIKEYEYVTFGRRNWTISTSISTSTRQRRVSWHGPASVPVRLRPPTGLLIDWLLIVDSWHLQLLATWSQLDHVPSALSPASPAEPPPPLVSIPSRPDQFCLTVWSCSSAPLWAQAASPPSPGWCEQRITENTKLLNIPIKQENRRLASQLCMSHRRSIIVSI